MKFDCPINDYSCSYYIAGICRMEVMEGVDPYLGCYTDDC